jgi:hypothetical protein
LVFRSLFVSTFKVKSSFVPYTCHAAVLFVDLSARGSGGGYCPQRCTSPIVGCQQPSQSILHIVHDHGGEVAVLPVMFWWWEATRKGY